MSTPLLSFIVLSYNYEDYIGTALRSILSQTMDDFEVIVVDDASADRSREVVQGFSDPRIRLIVNEHNLGGAGAYNVAVGAARGEWLVNVDADDWILPEKCARQLDFIATNPGVDVVGTWVSLVGPDGSPHPKADEIEPSWNKAHPLNLVDSWIGRNHLCRSSTMIRRAAHQRIGLDDAAMVRAPDHELWTRFLRMGSRFAVLPEKLTCLRLQPRGVTYGNALGSMVELSWSAIRNLLPVIEAQALWPSYERLCDWIVNHEQLPLLPARQRERLLSMLAAPPDVADFTAFKALLERADPAREAIGRRTLALARRSSELAYWAPPGGGPVQAGLPDYVAKLEADVKAYVEARDFWKGQSDIWEAAHKEVLAHANQLEANAQAFIDARDFWKGQSDSWEAACKGMVWQPLAHRIRHAASPRLLARRLSRFFRSS